MPETLITITQMQVGHVLGKGGSTLKGIQECTGAALEIVDGPKVKITADDDAKLRAAAAEVNKIVANQENPDYEGPEGMRLRKEANALGDKRSALFDEATAKSSAGDHAGANELVAAAKEAGEQMQAKHREAAIAISLHNNEAKGKGEDYFDMHGLREEEAMTMLEERVAVLEAKAAGTVTEFEVIPGAGHHSAPGAQKLKGATEAYLKRKGFQYTEASAGSFIAQVPGKVEGAAHPTADMDGRVPAADAAAAADGSVPHGISEHGVKPKDHLHAGQPAAASNTSAAPKNDSVILISMPENARKRRQRSNDMTHADSANVISSNETNVGGLSGNVRYDAPHRVDCSNAESAGHTLHEVKPGAANSCGAKEGTRTAPPESACANGGQESGHGTGTYESHASHPPASEKKKRKFKGVKCCAVM